MGRPTGRVKAAEVLERARRMPAGDPLDLPEMVRLTERFLELRRNMFRDAVDTSIELGELLIEGRPKTRGHYIRWIDRLGVSFPTAHNYEKIARLATTNASVIQKWKEIGTSKLYRVAALPAKKLPAVLKASSKQRIMRMNDHEFSEMISPHVKTNRKVTADMRAHGLRMKVRAWNATLRRARVGGIHGADLRKDLKTELRELCRLVRALIADL